MPRNIVRRGQTKTAKGTSEGGGLNKEHHIRAERDAEAADQRSDAPKSAAARDPRTKRKGETTMGMNGMKNNIRELRQLQQLIG